METVGRRFPEGETASDRNKHVRAESAAQARSDADDGARRVPDDVVSVAA